MAPCDRCDALLRGDRLDYAIHQRLPDPRAPLRRWPSSGFLAGDVFDLGHLIPTVAMPKERVESVAEEVADCVKVAASRLEAGLPKAARAKVVKLMQQRNLLSGLQTTALLWLNALLVQQRLFVQGAKVVDAGALESCGKPSEQVRVRREILERNWRSIFEPAVEALELASKQSSAAATEALEVLGAAVEAIETAPLGMYINVGAELYPKLTDDRKEAAAFYTQPATAELLAALAVRWRDLPADEWNDDVFVENNLADFACGTGTLLRAGYRRLEALHQRAGGDLGKRLHRSAMEQGIVGADVSPIAAHLTASSLAAIGYGEPYGETHIGWVEAGRNGQPVRWSSSAQPRSETCSTACPARQPGRTAPIPICPCLTPARNGC